MPFNTFLKLHTFKSSSIPFQYLTPMEWKQLKLESPFKYRWKVFHLNMSDIKYRGHVTSSLQVKMAVWTKEEMEYLFTSKGKNITINSIIIIIANNNIPCVLHTIEVSLLLCK